MASQQAEMIKDMMRQMRDQVLQTNVTLEEQRAGGEMMGMMATEPDGVTITATDANGVPAQWVTPDGAATDRVLLYLHGGGYVIGSMHTHTRLVGHLAKAIGCRALNVDYRLAPEHPYPAAVDDAVTAYRSLLDGGVAPHNIVIAGDSAGGGLTIATLVAIRAQGLPNPGAAVPMSPWVDLEGTGDSMSSKAADDLIVGADGLKMMADMYLNGQDAREPLAAPLYANLRGLPPMYVQVGGDETLLDDSTRIVAIAAAAGVEVRLDVFPEMQHVFQMSAGNVPEADDAIARIGAWLRPKLGL